MLQFSYVLTDVNWWFSALYIKARLSGMWLSLLYEKENDEMKRSSKRKLKRKLRNMIIFLYNHKRCIGIILLIIFLVSFMLSYASYMDTCSMNEMKEYVNDKVETVSSVEEKIIEREKVILKNPKLNWTHYNHIELSVNNIQQLPELPTGCEITSLAIVLNYLHPEKNIDKCDLSDNYLPKGEVGKTDPDKAFIGNPRRKNYSFGANAPVLVKAAEEWYKINMPDAGMNVEDVTNHEFKALLNYVIASYPVMVWTTINLLEPYESVKWTVDDKEISWIAQFHCVVLTGYDIDKQVYYIADPLNEGITEYDMQLFEHRYNQLGKQAVVIY